MSENKKITNAEYMISMLMGILEDNNIAPHPPIYIDDGGASEEAMVYGNIACPYQGWEEQAECRNNKLNEAVTREQCVTCKYNWLTKELDE